MRSQATPDMVVVSLSSERDSSDGMGGGLNNFFHRLSVPNLDDGVSMSQLRSRPVFQERSFLDRSKMDGDRPSHTPPAPHCSKDDPDGTTLALPTRGVVSISTAFVGVFLLFVTLLGASLMIVSAEYAAQSNALASDGTDTVQAIFSTLVDRSNGRLAAAANTSVGALTELISQQVHRRVEAAVANYTSWAHFVVDQLADMAESAEELALTDLDQAARRLWRLHREFPAVWATMVAGAADGSWIVVQNNIRIPPYRLMVRNTTSSSCRACAAAATPDWYFYDVPDPAGDPMRWVWTGRKIPIDPRGRPWYKAGAAAAGAGAWSDPYVFVTGSIVGITAVRAVVARPAGAGAGAPPALVGVVGADLTMDGMSSFLRNLKAEVDVAGPADTPAAGPPGSAADAAAAAAAAAAAGFQLALVHERGTLLATSAAAALTRDGAQLPWREALAGADASSLQEALRVIEDYWGGSLSNFFAPAAPAPAPGGAGGGGVGVGWEGFQTYPHDRLLIMTKRFQDRYGLRMMVVSAVPAAAYRGRIDAGLAAAADEAAADTRNASGVAAAVRAGVAANVRRNWTTQLLLSVGILAAGSAVVFCFAARISHTLRTMAAEMQRVAMLDFSDRSMYRSRFVDEVLAISRSFAIMDMNLLSFSRYVPENVVRLLTRKGTVAHLGVAPREVSVMFSDIVGFTTIAEELDPERLIALLAQYLEAMSDCIEESGGTVGKYIGDAIMAFWNSPTTVEDHANAACASALRQRERLEELRAGWEAEGLPPIYMRLGLSTGTVLHGNVGSQKRMEWTLIGDEVNLASRLEAMGKQYGVEVIISGAMHALVEHRFLARPLDRVVAVGKRRAVDVYELVAERGAATSAQRRYCADFAEVVAAYRAREFVRAGALAAEFETAFPGDVTARKYVDRCRHFEAIPPPDGWDGTFFLTSK